MLNWFRNRKSTIAPAPVSTLRQQVASLDPDAHAVLEATARLAQSNQHYQIAIPHLLIALIESTPQLRELFRASGLDPFATTAKAQARLEVLTTQKEGVPGLGPDVLGALDTATSGGTLKADRLALFRAILANPVARESALELAPELERVRVE